MRKCKVRGFELSATGLSLFFGAFCALQLSARCLSLRALFCLNMLALLHRCYIERLWDMGVIVALLLEVSRKIISYPGCGLFYGLPFGVMDAEGGIRRTLFLDVLRCSPSGF